MYFIYKDYNILYIDYNNVYIIHVMVGTVFAVTKLESIKLYLYLKPLVIFSVSVCISLLLYRLKFIKRK